MQEVDAYPRHLKTHQRLNDNKASKAPEQGCKADSKSYLNPSPRYLSCPIYALHEGGSTVFEKFSITGVDGSAPGKEASRLGDRPGMRVLVQELTSWMTLDTKPSLDPVLHLFQMRVWPPVFPSS